MKVTARIVIRSELSKKDNEYFTFIGSEGIEYLKLYFEESLKQGRDLNSNELGSDTCKGRDKAIVRIHS